MSNDVTEIIPPNRTVRQLESNARQVITSRLVSVWKMFSEVIHNAQTRKHRNLNLEELQMLRESLTLVYTIAPARSKRHRASEAWLRADKLIRFVDQQIKGAKEERATKLQERRMAVRETELRLKEAEAERSQKEHELQMKIYEAQLAKIQNS